MDKRLVREGSSAAKLVQFMREYGFNEEMSIEVGTIASISPISIHLESDGLILDKDDLIIAEHLTNHKRSVSLMIGNIHVTEIEFKTPLIIGDQVIVIGDNDTQFYYIFDRVGEL